MICHKFKLNNVIFKTSLSETSFCTLFLELNLLEKEDILGRQNIKLKLYLKDNSKQIPWLMLTLYNFKGKKKHTN